MFSFLWPWSCLAVVFRLLRPELNSNGAATVVLFLLGVFWCSSKSFPGFSCWQQELCLNLSLTKAAVCCEASISEAICLIFAPLLRLICFYSQSSIIRTPRLTVCSCKFTFSTVPAAEWIYSCTAVLLRVLQRSASFPKSGRSVKENDLWVSLSFSSRIGMVLL